MAGALLLVLALASSGCASLTERIVADALDGLAYEATYVPLEGGDGAALAALYAHVTAVLRVDVQYLPPDDPELRGAYGISYTVDDQMCIRLRQDLSVNGSIEVLAHEAAHLFQPPYLSRSQGDVFAEVVSAHVADGLGVPHAARTSAIWLRQHKPSIRVALDLQREIAHVVRVLMPGTPVTRAR